MPNSEASWSTSFSSGWWKPSRPNTIKGSRKSERIPRTQRVPSCLKPSKDAKRHTPDRVFGRLYRDYNSSRIWWFHSSDLLSFDSSQHQNLVSLDARSIRNICISSSIMNDYHPHQWISSIILINDSHHPHPWSSSMILINHPHHAHPWSSSSSSMILLAPIPYPHPYLENHPV